MDERAREVLAIESEAIAQAADRLDDSFAKARDLVLACRGRVVVTGLGKSGAMARKIASTLASTGTPSFYLHSAEAPHGDFGMVTPGDVLIAISYSGATQEVVDMLPYAKSVGVPVIAMTGRPDSPLGREADAVINCYVEREADPNNLAPTASAIVTLALGDALAITVMAHRKFGPQDFARFHPGGSLGKRLARCRDIMRTGDANPLVAPEARVFDVLFVMTAARSAGVASVVDTDGHLIGLFTDGDLRRGLARDPGILDRTVADVMTREPACIGEDHLAAEALRTLHDHKWDNMPVVDADGRPVGMIDVQDLLDANIL